MARSKCWIQRVTLGKNWGKLLAIFLKIMSRRWNCILLPLPCSLLYLSSPSSHLSQRVNGKYCANNAALRPILRTPDNSAEEFRIPFTPSFPHPRPPTLSLPPLPYPPPPRDKTPPPDCSHSQVFNTDSVVPSKDIYWEFHFKASTSTSIQSLNFSFKTSQELRMLSPSLCIQRS